VIQVLPAYLGTALTGLGGGGSQLYVIQGKYEFKNKGGLEETGYLGHV